MENSFIRYNERGSSRRKWGLFANMTKRSPIVTCAIVFTVIVLFNPVSCILYCVVGALAWSVSHPKIGENVKAVDWLPEEATNVSYYLNTPNRAYEFDISEEGFLAWTAHLEIKKITEPVGIGRYTRYHPAHRDCDPDAGTEIPKDHQCSRGVMVDSGYYYSTPPRGNGGGTHFTYDLETGRAYLSHASW
jgi:hypothetical protein